MRPFNLMINGLANIMQQSHSASHFCIEPQLRSHDPGKKADLYRVLQYVLCVASSELQLAQGFNQLIVNTMNAQIKGCLLAGFFNGDVNFLTDFFNHILNAGRVNSAV